MISAFQFEVQSFPNETICFNAIWKYLFDTLIPAIRDQIVWAGESKVN